MSSHSPWDKLKVSRRNYPVKISSYTGVIGTVWAVIEVEVILIITHVALRGVTGINFSGWCHIFTPPFTSIKGNIISKKSEECNE